MGVETDEIHTADVTRTFPLTGAVDRRTAPGLRRGAGGAGGRRSPRCGWATTSWPPTARPCGCSPSTCTDWGILDVPADVSCGDDPERPGAGHHRRWTLHGVSHSLGLDVHDCASARDEVYMHGPLGDNHVLTVEPGLYFQVNDRSVPAELRGIGVRIEDDIQVTATGPVNLSARPPPRPRRDHRLDARGAGEHAPESERDGHSCCRSESAGRAAIAEHLPTGSDLAEDRQVVGRAGPGSARARASSSPCSSRTARGPTASVQPSAPSARSRKGAQTSARSIGRPWQTATACGGGTASTGKAIRAAVDRSMTARSLGQRGQVVRLLGVEPTDPGAPQCGEVPADAERLAEVAGQARGHRSPTSRRR